MSGPRRALIYIFGLRPDIRAMNKLRTSASKREFKLLHCEVLL